MFITSKHHDGFCLWPSKYTDGNAMKMGPKKDILGQYFSAARKEGLKVGLYYSLNEWYNPLYTGKEAPYAGLKKVDNYVDDFMIPQIRELMVLPDLEPRITAHVEPAKGSAHEPLGSPGTNLHPN